MSDEDAARQVRLSVNVAGDVAEVLEWHSAIHGVSVTEAVRRAILLLSIHDEEVLKGHRLAYVTAQNELHIPDLSSFGM